MGGGLIEDREGEGAARQSADTESLGRGSSRLASAPRHTSDTTHPQRKSERMTSARHGTARHSTARQSRMSGWYRGGRARGRMVLMYSEGAEQTSAGGAAQVWGLSWCW